MMDANTQIISKDSALVPSLIIDDIQLNPISAAPEHGRLNAALTINGVNGNPIAVNVGDANTSNRLAEEIAKRFNGYRGAFIEGWWNCLISFGNEILSHSSDTTIIKAVLDSAGVERGEIDNVFADSMNEDVICDKLKTFLTDYNKTL